MKKLFFGLLLACIILQNAFAQVDFRKETIYFLITSRFFDGDTSNNAPNEWCSYIPGVANSNITDNKDVSWRGDFKGLIQKLDYIKGMGFTAIWITPVVQNRGPLDYHGYHAWDFTKVDARLESPGAGFQDLINAVHAKGMKIVLDIVTNHSGRFGIKNLAELKYNTDPSKPWGQTSAGTTLPDNPNWEYDGLTPNPDDGKRWSRANLAKMPAPYNTNLPAWNWPCTESFVNTSDPNYFHHSGNGFVQGWDDTTNCYQRGISDDCPDLNTGSPALQDYMFNAYKTFLDMGVDAFRWDTWKHMNKQDIFALYDRFKAYKPDLFVFGEVAQKRFDLHSVEELNPHWYTWRGGVGNSAAAGVGVLDFYGEATFHNIFENGGAFSGVTDAARYDNLYSDPSLLITWLDNHDFGPNNDWNRRYGGSVQNLASCMNFMFTWRGIPCVYYGTEEQFKIGEYTDIHDASGIQKSLDLTGRAYYGNEFSTAQNHVLYKHFKKLNDIRKAIPALQSGNWNWGGNYPGNGIGFTRILGAQVVAVGLAKDGTASFNFTGLSNGIYRDAVTGREVNVTGGNLSFTVTSNSAGIYVLNGLGMIGESGTGFFEACVTGCATKPTIQISPIGDNYTLPVTIAIAASGGTGTLTIHYTVDGSLPTASSPVYISSFVVSTATTVRAIAIDVNGKISDLDGQVYTFVLPKPKVLISPAAGNYYNSISASINATTGTAPYSIYYTTDGSAPTTASTVYSSAINVSVASTIKAIAVDANNQFSTIASNAYTFNIPAPVITANPLSGNFYLGNVNVSLNASSPRLPVTIYYTIDGTTPSTASAQYSSAINLAGPIAKTIKYFGVDNQGRTSAIDSQQYTFNPIPDITIYFKKPVSWSTPIKIYYWNAIPTGAVTPTTWPGIVSTQQCSGGDWWKFTFSGVTSINAIFNDGAGHQTADLLNITADSYFDFNTKLTTIPDIDKPIARLITTPITGTAPLTVSFNASASSGCTQLGFFWDFGNGSSQQTGINGSTTQIYTAAGSYPMSVVVQDQNNKRDTITQTITVTNASVEQILHLKPAISWTNTPPKIYYWNTTPVTTSIGWPGVSMINEGGGWWKYTIAGVNCSNLIFNNNSSPQTADLYHCNEGWYDGTIPAWISNPLPVMILNFECFLLNGSSASSAWYRNFGRVGVKWQTSTEINCSYFNVQRSFNGKEFINVGKVISNNRPSEYRFTDDHLPLTTGPEPRVVYYRLEIIDNDGSKTYSTIKEISTMQQASNLTVFPNPAKDYIMIEGCNDCQISITDNIGKVVLNTATSNFEHSTLNIRHLSKGLYMVLIKNNKGEILVQQKLIKE